MLSVCKMNQLWQLEAADSNSYLRVCSRRLFIVHNPASYLTNTMTSKKPSDPNSFDDVNTRPASADEVSYRDGYVHGRSLEQQSQSDREQVRESNSTANGLFIGVLFVALIGMGAAAFFYANRSNEPVRGSTTSPSPAAVQPQQKETTIIERTIDRTQEVVPAAPPDIKINISPPQPANPGNTGSSAPATSTGSTQTEPSPQPEASSQPEVVPSPQQEIQNTPEGKTSNP